MRADEIMERLREPGSAVVVDWDHETYAADRMFVSRSMLEDLNERGPAYYYARHIARTIPPRKSDSLTLGQWVHSMILEPHDYQRRLYPAAPKRPDGAKGNAAMDSTARALFEKWMRASEEWRRNRPRDAISPDEGELRCLSNVLASVYCHAHARWLLMGPQGRSEVTVLWHHPLGLLLRCRLDRVREYNGSLYVSDLKTTSDPEPVAFGRDAFKYGLHVQAAMYMDAIAAANPGKPVDYSIVAVRTSPPYETAVYTLEDDGPRSPIGLGRATYEDTIRRLIQHQTTGVWSAPWQTEATTLTLPGWAYANRI